MKISSPSRREPWLRPLADALRVIVSPGPLLLILLVVAGLGSSGCAIVEIETDPPGARILCSDNGLPPWRPWRPECGADVSPSKSVVWGGTFRFFRAEKEGYYPTPPQLTDAFVFNREKIEFELTPTPELVARQNREAGLFFSEPDGKWIDPRSIGLVEHDGEWVTPGQKTALENTAAGLVEFEGQWVTPEERDRLFSERQLAAGLVVYKGSWVMPDERKRLAEIDEIVDAAFNSDSSPLPPFQETLQPIPGRGRIWVTNLTDFPIRIVLSGPTPMGMVVESLDDAREKIPPGRYRVALIPGNTNHPIQIQELTVADMSGREESVTYSLLYEVSSQ